MLLTKIVILFLFGLNLSNGQHSGLIVKLENVQSLTFFKDEETAGRKLKPTVTQLQCQGGECHHQTPRQVTCYNKGTDGIQIQWQCETSDLPIELKLGKTKVVCEGFDDHPKETFVFYGSCSLEYTLEKSNQMTLKDYYIYSLISLGFSALINLILMGLLMMLAKYCFNL